MHLHNTILQQCMQEGIGVEEDFNEALNWFRKAAEQGIAESQFSLGLAY